MSRLGVLTKEESLGASCGVLASQLGPELPVLYFCLFFCPNLKIFVYSTIAFPIV